MVMNLKGAWGLVSAKDSIFFIYDISRSEKQLKFFEIKHVESCVFFPNNILIRPTKNSLWVSWNFRKANKRTNTFYSIIKAVYKLSRKLEIKLLTTFLSSSDYGWIFSCCLLILFWFEGSPLHHIYFSYVSNIA